MNQSTARKLLSGLFGFLALTVAGQVFAAADLNVTLQGPSNPTVYTAATYTATVRNIGNKAANAVSLQIVLPLTTTSPAVYILGELSGIDSRCQLINRVLKCSLGNLARSAVMPISFSFKLPQAAKVLSFGASVSTSSLENSSSNNSMNLTPSLDHPELVIAGDREILNSHCTGTALSSFFECKVSPGSIAQHAASFHQDGSISFAEAPEYSGEWNQNTSTKQLNFQYFENGTPILEFTGWAVDDSCFEGISNFLPTSPYLSPYRVCLQ